MMDVEVPKWVFLSVICKSKVVKYGLLMALSSKKGLQAMLKEAY